MTDKALSLTLTMDQSDTLYSLYPELQQLEQPTLLRLFNHSMPVNMPPGTLLQTENGVYQHLFLLLEGTTRVFQTHESGREFTFYRNYPGDICAVNLQMLMQQPYSSYVQAETAIHGLQFSRSSFKQALEESDAFRHFIFKRFAKSIHQLTRAGQDSVFKRLDARLCDCLRKLFTASGKATLNITHQQLANELGTTREVISRSLKALEQKGCIKITRGQLTILSVDNLN